MNQLDKKILETLGWTYSEERIVFPDYHWYNPNMQWAHQPDITTDMLVEAACKEWSEKGFVLSYWPKRVHHWMINAISDDLEIDHCRSMVSAIRAALAAHWGIEDA